MKNKIGMCLTAKNPTKEWYIKSSLTIISNNNDEQQESSPRRKFYWKKKKNEKIINKNENKYNLIIYIYILTQK